MTACSGHPPTTPRQEEGRSENPSPVVDDLGDPPMENHVLGPRTRESTIMTAYPTATLDPARPAAAGQLAARVVPPSSVEHLTPAQGVIDDSTRRPDT